MGLLPSPLSFIQQVFFFGIYFVLVRDNLNTATIDRREASHNSCFMSLETSQNILDILT